MGTALAIGLALAGCGGGGGEPQVRATPSDEAGAPATSTSSATTPASDAGRFPDWPMTDFTRTTIDLDEVLRGCPDADCIPPLDAEGATDIPGERGGLARFAAASTLTLAERMPIVLVRVNGDVRGYPLHILTWHEIVNDTVGGVPVAVTFCPLCNTAITFDRRVEGMRLDFGVSGNLRNSDLIMWDRQTHSWWQQATGEGIVGEHAGIRLKPLSTSIVSWSTFATEFPEALVLTEETGLARDYGINPYGGYDTPGTTPFLFNGTIDPRLDGLSRVLTLDHNSDRLALPFAALAKEGVANVEVGGARFSVFWAAGTASALGAERIEAAEDIGAAVAYDAVANGELLTFIADGAGGFRDEQTGSSWSITGMATDGPMAGTQLGEAIHTTQFWFAWAAFHPDTRVWEAGP